MAKHLTVVIKALFEVAIFGELSQPSVPSAHITRQC